MCSPVETKQIMGNGREGLWKSCHIGKEMTCSYIDDQEGNFNLNRNLDGYLMVSGGMGHESQIESGQEKLGVLFQLH